MIEKLFHIRSFHDSPGTNLISPGDGDRTHFLGCLTLQYIYITSRKNNNLVDRH